MNEISEGWEIMQLYHFLFLQSFRRNDPRGVQ